MKKPSPSQSAFFNPRFLISFAFCVIGAVIALVAFAAYPGGNAFARQEKAAAPASVATEPAARLPQAMAMAEDDQDVIGPIAAPMTKDPAQPNVITATFVVNTTVDTADAAAGDGNCADSTGACSLRAAISEANALAGADIITLPAGTYTATLVAANEDVNAGGDFDITSAVTINGAGSGTTIIEANAAPNTATEKVLHIVTASAPVVAINDVTIRHGNSTVNTVGGGVRLTAAGAVVTFTNVIITLNRVNVAGNCFAGGLGITAGTITLTGCTVSNNSAISTVTTGNGFAGGIYNQQGTVNLVNTTVTGNIASSFHGGIRSLSQTTASTVNITNSTISNNAAQGNNTTAGGGPGEGGGLANFAVANTANATVTITGTTFNANAAQVSGAPGANTAAGGIENISVGGTTGPAVINLTNSTVSGNDAAFGGGIYNDGPVGTVNLNYCTVASNTATTQGGGMMQDTTPGGVINLKSSIVADNTAPAGPNISGTITSQNFNHIEDPIGGTFAAMPNDVVAGDPALGALANNGGPTFTHLPGVLVLDTIPPASNECGTTVIVDQRGLLRPFGVGCDKGSVEVQGVVSPTPSPGTPTPTPSTTPSPTIIPSPTPSTTPTATASPSCAPVTVSYTGAPVAIPDSNTTGVNLVVAVAGVGTITDLDFRFDGTVSSPDPLSTTVGVNHSWVGDMIFRLTSPGGTTVTFYDRPGVPASTFGCSSNNLFALTLDDEAAAALEGQCPGGTDAGPLTGSFTPNNALSAFDGQNPNGNWTLTAIDAAGGDTGTVRAFSLIFGGACATPSPTATPTVTPSTPTPTVTPSTPTPTVTPSTPTPTVTPSTPTPTVTPSTPTPTATASPTCPPVITHSSSQAITPLNSVSCNNASGHADNSYWRAFNMATFVGGSDYNVTSVSFGVEEATGAGGTQPVTVRLYTNSSGAFPAGTRTQIATTTIQVLDSASGTVLNVPLAATVPAGAELVMEVFTPNGQATGNFFFIGSNTAAETGPSYLSAADCGIANPTDTATIGFPDMNIVFNVLGSCVPGTTPTPTPTATPETPTPTPETPTPTPSSPTPSPSTSPSPVSKAINLSTRMLVQTGDRVGIGGFIITGNAPKDVIVRAIGPTLTQFDVPNVLADPVLELHGPSGFTTVINNNWRDTQEDEIQNTGIPPTNDLESAIVATLDPGAYTAVVRGNGNTSGVALVEVYDLNQGVDSKLANLSTRAFVSIGDNIVIAGFLLSDGGAGITGLGGPGDDRVIVRGIGPSLAPAVFPAAAVLADPTLELRDANGTLIVSNNDWQDNGVQAAEITAAGLAPTNSVESAIAATLPPGLYTALLAGLNCGTGIGIVEIYDRGPEAGNPMELPASIPFQGCSNPPPRRPR